MTLSEKQNQMIQEINALGDCFDQYHYLIIASQQLAPMPEEHKNSTTLVPGCQSQVWLYTQVQDGTLYMEADSDTLILRGVLKLLYQLFQGEKICDIAELPVTLFQETELAATFTSDRNTGLQSILRHIQTIT